LFGSATRLTHASLIDTANCFDLQAYAPDLMAITKTVDLSMVPKLLAYPAFIGPRMSAPETVILSAMLARCWVTLGKLGAYVCPFHPKKATFYAAQKSTEAYKNNYFYSAYWKPQAQSQ
jgi:hypothetical protein